MGKRREKNNIIRARGIMVEKAGNTEWLSGCLAMEHTARFFDESSPNMLDHEINPAINMPSEVEAGHDRSRTTRRSLLSHEFDPAAAASSDKRRKVDNIAVLLKARTDLNGALGWCEKRLAIMEGDYLRRWPNVLAATPQQYFEESSTRPPPQATDILPPGPSVEKKIRKKVNPKERIFSQTSCTSAFWKSRESRRSKRYRHGVDTPPLGFYAGDRSATRLRSSSEGEAVVAYDAYRRRWMPVPRRELEHAALEQAAGWPTGSRQARLL